MATSPGPSTFELHPLPPRPSHKFTQESRPPTPRDIYELFPPHSPHPSSTSFPSPSAPKWKRSLYNLLEAPTSSPSAFTVHVLSTGLIVLSALITVLETVPAFHYISGRTWFGMESALVALFTVEYIARCVAWSWSWGSLFKWALSFFGIIDLLSVLPYYIELALHQDTSVLFRFSILRMFRLLRVFRPFRYNHTILLTIEVMYLSVRRSQHALLAIGFFVIMILTVFSTLLYFAERGTWDDILDTFVNSDGDPTQFTSIPAAAWFVIVTITTVGYGEITPRSFLGRLVTLPILVFGLLLITLPSFVLGREFSLVWGAMVEGVREGGGGAGVGGDSNNVEGSEGEGGRERDDGRRGQQGGRHEGGDRDESERLLRRPARRRPVDDDFRIETGYPPPSSLPYPPPFPSPSYDPFLLHTHPHPPSTPSRDLTNLKLAQNQTELSRQIEELKGVVEAQGRVLGRLLELLSRGEDETAYKDRPREEGDRGR